MAFQPDGHSFIASEARLTQHFSLSPTRMRSTSCKMAKASYSLFPPPPPGQVALGTLDPDDQRPRQDSTTLPIPVSTPSVSSASAPPPLLQPPFAALPPRPDSAHAALSSDFPLPLRPPPKSPLRARLRSPSPLPLRPPPPSNPPPPVPTSPAYAISPALTVSSDRTTSPQPRTPTDDASASSPQRVFAEYDAPAPELWTSTDVGATSPPQPRTPTRESANSPQPPSPNPTATSPQPPSPNPTLDSLVQPAPNIGVFRRFAVGEPTKISIHPSNTTSVLGREKAHVFLGNHTVYVGDRPIFQWVQGLFSRRTIQCVHLNGQTICTLKRAKTKGASGHASLQDAAGRELAHAKWNERAGSGVDLAVSLWDNLFAPADAPTASAAPTLTMRHCTGGSIEYRLESAGRTVATLSRLPVAGEPLDVRIEEGMDACFVSATVVAAMYAVRDLYVAVYSKAAAGEQRVESYMDQLLLEAQQPMARRRS